MIKILFLFLFTTICFGQAPSERFVADESRDDSGLEVGVDFAQQDSFMDDVYQKGAFLVYDCDRMHWVCTGQEEFNQCAKRRKEAMILKKDNLSCAYFAPYPSRSKCHEKQVEMTNRGTYPRFCLHPEAKANNKSF